MEENKKKFALWIHPSAMEKVERLYQLDNCRSKSEFIEKAINFYCGYLTAENYKEYFPEVIVSTVQGALDSFENRMASLMPYYTKLYRNDELPPRAKLVYIYLHDRMDQENKAWPSIHTIAKDLSISRSTVKRAIKDLEKAELIRKEPHYRHNGSATSNRYYLL